MPDRTEICTRFWEVLIDRAKGRTTSPSSSAPRADCRLHQAKAGPEHVSFIYGIRGTDAEVALYRRGNKSEGEDVRYRVYEALRLDKEALEEALGASLDWEHRGNLNWAIARKIEGGGYRDEDRWPEIADSMIDEMIRLEAAFRPLLVSIPD